MPKQLEMYINYSNPDMLHVAAWYLQRLIQTHYFMDGNKRIAFTTTSIFLEINGFQFKDQVGLDDLYDFVISIANSEPRKLRKLQPN